MKNKRIANLLFAGLFLFPGIQRVNPGLIIATPTPTATPAIKFINPNLVKNLGKLELKFTNKRAELSNVKVTAKDTASITVDNGGASVKVDVASTTHFRRKFWGGSDLGEISVGDSVDVVGRWTSEDKTEIKAVVIRDLSIQKRFGVFFGNVKTITDTGFTMTTIQRGEEAVTLDSTTKLVNRKGETITAADIQVGNVIRVRGMWNSSSFTITEVVEVKDFSLP